MRKLAIVIVAVLACGTALADECTQSCDDQYDACGYGCAVYACIQECQYARDQCYQACPPACTPNFQEISREVQGTYGEGYYFYCEHHRVEWVTQYDVNQCAASSSGWYQYYCHDETDGYKFGGGSDCCDDNPPGYGFTCNHYHHCTG